MATVERFRSQPKEAAQHIIEAIRLGGEDDAP
jgi:hypothetical protein